MKVCLVLLALVVASARTEGRRSAAASTTTTTEEADKIMAAIEAHCTARKKRNSAIIAPEEDDDSDVRKLILNIIKGCLEDDGTSPTTPQSPTPHPVGGPCTSSSTVNLTEDWRLDRTGSNIKPVDGNYNCDAYLFDNIQWFRITGAAGNRIRDSCPAPYSCGSLGAIWTNATHPYLIGDTWQVPLYGSWAGNCNWYPWAAANPLTVLKCGPGNDYVYKIDGLSGCYHSICGMQA